MKFHYGGIYKSENDLKAFGDSHEGEVAFREPAHKTFSIIANVGSVLLAAVLLAVIFLVGRPELKFFMKKIYFAAILSLLTLIPHELLHALCFKGDVYLYFNPSKLLAFVHGPESMSKSRFIFMSLLPNLAFGLIPYAAFFFDRDLLLIGCLGAICIGMGFGDYINVFNAATQMPKGAKTFLRGFKSYWYVPQGDK